MLDIRLKFNSSTIYRPAAVQTDAAQTQDTQNPLKTARPSSIPTRRDTIIDFANKTMKNVNFNNLTEKTLQSLARQSASALFDSYAMRRALRLAASGSGQVSENSPLVGCLIVCENGSIVGEGFYGADNLKHAEIVALEMAGERARHSTVYVTLEPHAHFSRTAPCTDALIAAGVSRVVTAMIDPNPLVAGRGIEILRAAGIETEVGLLEDAARRLNRCYIERFNMLVRKKKAPGLPRLVGAWQSIG